MPETDIRRGQTGSSDKLADIARIFHLLGTDCKKNIDIILEQTCTLLQGVCSLYNRIDDRKKSLIVWAGHRVPPDIDRESDPAGHICWEATIKGRNRPVVLPDLEATPFFRSDPYVQKYNLKSYLGFPVKAQKKVIGSLCIVDTIVRQFTPDEINCIQTLAAALSLEEERLCLRNELTEEKQRYQVLVENANDGIYIIQDGTLKFVNPRVIELSGYDWDELSKLHFTLLVHPDDRNMVFENHIRRLRGEIFQTTYSFRLLTKTGKIVWVQINSKKIIWQNAPAVLGCIRDISQTKLLEEKLKRAEKMELIGTMAGGVAHDLNNILSGLVSYPELLLMQIEPDSPLKEPISFIHNAGLKAADIVQDLLTLTRRGITIEEIINLNQAVREYMNSPAFMRLRNEHPQIDFQTDLDPDLLNIKGSPSHIAKILMNLVINAAEAVQDRGCVTISTFNKYVEEPIRSYATMEEGDYAVIKISDTGCGISEKDLNRIFEPFYTKKQMGRSGSGLGLSVVWNCVKDHKGYIEAISQEHSGTSFEIYFPATRKQSNKEADKFIIDDFRGYGQTILVVDDIEAQRKIASDVLSMLGYTPVSVSCGEDACDFVKTRRADLILLDMRMEPGIDGLETFKRIIELNPGQKAIIASGFSEDDRVKQALRLGAGLYIKKPYTLKKLAVALRQELEP